MAARSLSPKQILGRLQRHRVAVRVRAMQIAKTAVKDQLRAQGLKIWHFSTKEITQLAEDYFANHREELITKATEDINTWPGFARWRLPDCANIESNAQSEKPPISTTSPLQISGAK